MFSSSIVEHVKKSKRPSNCHIEEPKKKNDARQCKSEKRVFISFGKGASLEKEPKQCARPPSCVIIFYQAVLITPDPVTEFSIDACCFQCKLTNNFTSHNRKFPLERTGILGNVRVFLGASIRAQAELHMPQAYRISLLDIQR